MPRADVPGNLPRTQAVLSSERTAQAGARRSAGSAIEFCFLEDSHAAGYCGKIE